MRAAQLTLLLLLGFACGRVERDAAGTSDHSAAGAPDESACEEQQLLYAEYREQVIEQLAMNACDEADDCSLFEDRTGCSPACSYAIPNNARRAIDDRLYAYAEQNCDPTCPPPPLPPCAPRPPAACVMGLCR